MTTGALDRRLKALEASGTHHISTLADYVLWQARGRPEPVAWDPGFEKQLKEALDKL